MDCQMPVMDGYEATASIRALGDKRRAATPIVALTANSMQGDEQKCRAAGMDGFLAKPYSISGLGAVLQRWLPESNETTGGQGVEAPAVVKDLELPAALNERVLDSLRSLDSKGGMELVHRILRTFRETVPAQLERIEGAVKTGDTKLMGQVAHMLKSSTGSIGAESLSSLYRQMEMLARENRVDGASELLPQIQNEQTRVMRRISELLPG
jgi:HPt (histidine-containing phosphotransfer) domain-containing protein